MIEIPSQVGQHGQVWTPSPPWQTLHPPVGLYLAILSLVSCSVLSLVAQRRENCASDIRTKKEQAAQEMRVPGRRANQKRTNAVRNIFHREGRTLSRAHRVCCVFKGQFDVLVRVASRFPTVGVVAKSLARCRFCAYDRTTSLGMTTVLPCETRDGRYETIGTGCRLFVRDVPRCFAGCSQGRRKHMPYLPRSVVTVVE